MKSLDHFTVEYLLSHTIEEGECLIWTGENSEGKYPRMKLAGQTVPVRRVLYGLVHGNLMPGKQVGIYCKTTLCVHPDCLIQRTKRQAQQGLKLRPDHVLRVTMGRRRIAKIDAATVAEIRASDEYRTTLAERFGVSLKHISYIRNNRVWKDHANPFAGLGARA